MPRGCYTRIALADRERIVRVQANNGGNWRELAEQLGVKYKTECTWIRADVEHPKPKGGSRKKLTNDQIDNVVTMIERDLCLTLKQLSERTEQELGSTCVSQLSITTWKGGS